MLVIGAKDEGGKMMFVGEVKTAADGEAIRNLVEAVLRSGEYERYGSGLDGSLPENKGLGNGRNREGERYHNSDIQRAH
ncbi:MAG: hypothetical protein QXL15_02500 [Candidatus Korarchaeota archaeon]